MTETPPCAWCGEPSVVLLTIEPAHYGTSKGRKVCTQQAIQARACHEHSGRTQNQPPAVRTPSTTRASKEPGPDQMTIYDALADEAA